MKSRSAGHTTTIGDRPLLFSAYATGYGPAAKALAIATRCTAAGLESVFVGRGVAYELVSRSERVFDRVVEASPDGAAARALARKSSALVSVMEREAARLATEESRPLHVVDSLLFMRDRVPDAFLGAERYWAQRFPGVEPAADQAVRPTVVGPILSATPPARTAERSGLVVNLGGFERNGDFASDRRYIELVLRALEATAAEDAGGIPVQILASARTAAGVRELRRATAIETASLAHRDALEALARAEAIITAPGLTATLECFRLGRPVFFLPPRNYSQWCVLRTLRARGVAANALHWEDLGARFRLGERLPEAVRNPCVHAAIDELAPSRDAQAAVAGLFEAAIGGDHRARREEQQAFLRSLGGDGAQAIADELAANARANAA